MLSHENKVLDWTDGELETEALEQALNIVKYPFVKGPVRLMPDAHPGMGVPIGAVFQTERVYVPNAVGVDISCGMHSMKTNLEGISEGQIKEWMGKIRGVVPVGFASNSKPRYLNIAVFTSHGGVLSKQTHNLEHQLGTLGGGNHFIEIQRDETGAIWVTVHSGSRNPGKQVCEYYNKEAERLNALWGANVQPKLAFLPADTEVGKMYGLEMHLCMGWATLNRMAMMEAIFDACPIAGLESVQTIETIHNYCDEEFVHRKGAVNADTDLLCTIPGSMGTASYIVRGLGSKSSLHSASHGAGRRFSRTEANRRISVEDADASMSGVVYGRWSTDRKGEIDLSEAPAAYKDIDEVMGKQKDLVEIVHKLKPIGVIKG